MADNAPMDRSDDDDLVTLPDGRVAQLWQGGTPAGPVVFFLHGCPDTRRAAFSGAEAARRAGVRLVAVNRPGYGRSEPCASPAGDDQPSAPTCSHIVKRSAR